MELRRIRVRTFVESKSFNDDVVYIVVKVNDGPVAGDALIRHSNGTLAALWAGILR